MPRPNTYIIPFDTLAIGETFDCTVPYVTLKALRTEFEAKTGRAFYVTRNADGSYRVLRMADPDPACGPNLASTNLLFARLAVGQQLTLLADHPLFTRATDRALRAKGRFDRYINYETGSLTFTRIS